MKRLLLMAGLICTVTHAVATPQLHDSLEFEGQKGFIEQYPATSLLQNRDLNFAPTSSANHRGFISSWSVHDGYLYLTKFKGQLKRHFLFFNYTRNVDLKWLFPDTNGEVPATWFSGEIHLHLGKYRLVSAASLVVATETMVVFLIKHGRVVNTTRFTYPDNVPVINALHTRPYGDPYDLEHEKGIKRISD